MHNTRFYLGDISVEIQIEEAAMINAVQKCERDLELATEVMSGLQRLQNFCLDAAPTRTNIGLVNAMIADLEQKMGWEGAIKVAVDAKYRKQMQELDEEGLKEIGRRVWRSISQFIIGIYNAVRSFFFRSEKEVEEKSRKIKGLKEMMLEEATRHENTISNLGLTAGGKLSKADQEMIQMNGGGVILTHDKRLLRWSEIQDDLLVLSGGKFTKQLPGYLAPKGLDNIKTAIRRNIDALNVIAKIGWSEEIASYVRTCLAIHNERDLIKAAETVDVSKDYVEKSVDEYKQATRTIGGGFDGLEIGRDAIMVGSRKQGDFRYIAGTKKPSRNASAKLSTKGKFSWADFEEVESLLIELNNAVNGVKSQLDLGLEVYNDLGKSNCAKMAEATVRIRELELGRTTEQLRPKVHLVASKSHEIIGKSKDHLQLAYAAGSDAASNYHDLLALILSYRLFEQDDKTQTNPNK
jgi:hypothetical protein